MIRGLPIALLLPIAAGCGQADGGDAPMDRSTYVAAYVDLREAVMLDDSLGEQERDSILALHGISADEMRAYIERHAHDPAALADTWREVMDSIAARDSVAAHDSLAARDSAAGADSVADPPGPDYRGEP